MGRFKSDNGSSTGEATTGLALNIVIMKVKISVTILASDFLCKSALR